MPPSVESLEGRDLPSALAPRAVLPGRVRITDTPTGTPTRHERARERFSATFFGPYVLGRGRFVEQARQASFQGGGTSSAFLHGNFLMALFTPEDPSEPITGTATLFDKNYPQTGNSLVLDLTADRDSMREGLPTRLSWEVSDSSQGAFLEAKGQGTATIRYLPGGPLPARALAAGRAGVQFRGQVITNGAVNPLRVR